jgi:hypothetical protein
LRYCKRLLIAPDGLRGSRTQADGHADDLRVLAVVGDAVADGESRHAFAELDDRSDVAAPQRQRLIKFGPDGIKRGRQAVGPDLLETARALSGCCRGFARRPARPNSRSMRSVPRRSRIGSFESAHDFSPLLDTERHECSGARSQVLEDLSHQSQPRGYVVHTSTYPVAPLCQTAEDMGCRAPYAATRERRSKK